jgi:CheY-like chemotaxis protein
MPAALVVDDNRQSADALCRMLKLLGLTPHPAYGPRAALLALNELVPDIIFLDINMSGVDGFEIMAYLRRLPQLAETPVVFITSDDQPETERKASSTGALRLLIKPASISALERVLKDAGLID